MSGPVRAINLHHPSRLSGAFFALVAAWTPAVGQEAGSRELLIQSRDGTGLRGVEERPAGGGKAVVIMVAGTGLTDRDLAGTLEATGYRMFEDMSIRLRARGLAVVRYDRRGVRYRRPGPSAVDAPEAASATVGTHRDDLRAIYDRTRSTAGAGGRCIILLGHSEGVRHIAEMAESGAPAPLLVVGIGAPMRSPIELMRWQMAERAIHVLQLMDTDGNGEITEAEIDAKWRGTPASGFPGFNGPNRPRKTLTGADLQRIGRWQLVGYGRERQAALALDDAAPFPDAKAPLGRASWWKSWFTDARPIAGRLSAWPSPTILHYGEIDSQVLPDSEIAAARAALGARLTVLLHPARGHALGKNALLGPMDEVIAEQIVDEIAEASRGCSA